VVNTEFWFVYHDTTQFEIVTQLGALELKLQDGTYPQAEPSDT